MNQFLENEEYREFVSSILNHKEFSKLESIKHHDSNRLKHSLRVSYYSYLIAKKLHLDCESVARGGLLHDFFIERTVNYDTIKEKVKLYTVDHPGYALENAQKYFNLNEKEANMIRSHMFPLDYHVPKYKESWVVNLVDKGVSFYEFGKKFQYQLAYTLNLYLILLINLKK